MSKTKRYVFIGLVPFLSFGYVCAAWNPLFHDLIKIGATLRHKPYMRVAKLSTSTLLHATLLHAAAGAPDAVGGCHD